MGLKLLVSNYLQITKLYGMKAEKWHLLGHDAFVLRAVECLEYLFASWFEYASRSFKQFCHKSSLCKATPHEKLTNKSEQLRLQIAFFSKCIPRKVSANHAEGFPGSYDENAGFSSAKKYTSISWLETFSESVARSGVVEGADKNNSETET